MPMHTHSSVDTGSSNIVTLLSRAGPTASPPLPTTQGDIQAILQQEQDHAMSLLSLSPLLSSLFLSYANRAAVIESASAPDSRGLKALQNTIAVSQEEIEKLKAENLETVGRLEAAAASERKALQAIITALREENEKLKSESRGMAGRLEAAEASQEVLHSQVSSLGETSGTQQDEIKTLRAELSEARSNYDRLIKDSSAEKVALKVQISDLEGQRGQLRDTAVKQQIRISKLERPPEALLPIRGPRSPPMRHRESSVSTPSLPDSPISPFHASLPNISDLHGGGGPTSPVPLTYSPAGSIKPHPLARGLVSLRYKPGTGELQSGEALSGWFADEN